MHVETGLSPAFALKSAYAGKKSVIRYFKKNVWVKGLSSVTISTVTPVSTPSYHESGMRLVYFYLVVRQCFNTITICSNAHSSPSLVTEQMLFPSILLSACRLLHSKRILHQSE